MKTQQDLEKAFTDISASTGWSFDGDNAWGYFFYDTNPELLEVISDALTGDGYRKVALFEMEPEGWMLHVERIEKHDPRSLFNRNAAMTKLAKEHGVAAYDGWDVTPVVAK